MPKNGESSVEVKLSDHTLCVMALWRHEDGSYSIVGMRGITSGSFVSSRKIYGLYERQVLREEVAQEEISSLAALGGELFMINQMDLRASAEELREILQQIVEENIRSIQGNKEAIQNNEVKS